MLRPEAPRLVEGVEGKGPFGSGTMLIPTPRLVEAVVWKVPVGGVMVLSELRRRLAEAHGADFACPLTTGIFLRIVAEAAEEELKENPAAAVAPWWRVVRDDGKLIDKFPGAPSLQADRLRAEGLSPLEGRGGKWRVPLA